MSEALRGRAVLVTGGTAGIGLATGLAFGRLGADVFLTYRWGNHDEAQILRQFETAGATVPQLVEADASHEPDTRAVMERIGQTHEGLHALISNVAFGHVSQGLDDLSRRALHMTMSYCTWPLVEHLQQARRTFDRLPRYAVAISSTGPRTLLPGYTYIAAAKAALETYGRYLAATTLGQPFNLNVVVANPVVTESLRKTMGPDFEPFCRKYGGEGYFLQPDEVAAAAVALASGLMDAVHGQALVLDRGGGFSDSISGLFARREELGL